MIGSNSPDAVVQDQVDVQVKKYKSLSAIVGAQRTLVLVGLFLLGG